MKPKRRTAGQSQVAHEILAYLTEHPKAQDTLEGIVEWWVMEQQIKRGIAQVKNALAELVTQGLVLERKGKDGRIHYQMNRRKAEEIRVLLKERKASIGRGGEESRDDCLRDDRHQQHGGSGRP